MEFGGVQSSEMDGKSIYWKYFIKNKLSPADKKSTAKCKLCDITISLGGVGKSANTSNMKYHLEKKHPQEYYKLKGTDSSSG